MIDPLRPEGKIFPVSNKGGGLFALLGGLFSSGGNSVTGLSIGTSSIKLVELKRSGRGWRLAHFGFIPLPEDSVVNREIINPVSLIESTRSLIERAKPKNRAVCTAISGTALIIKKMTLESVQAKDLEEQVFWEAEQYLPFDVSEVVLDYQVLSKTKENKTEVLLVAVKKSVLDSYMSVVEEAGLKPKIVDTDFFAIQNAYELNYPQSPNEATALIDIGASGMKLCIVHRGVPIFTKDSALGGRSLTADIQKHLNLSYVDAENLKSGQSGQVPQEVSDLMGVAADNMAQEIKRTLDFYSASGTGPRVSLTLLAGGSAKISNLTQVIEEHTGVKTQLLNPFATIQVDSRMFTQDYIAAIAPLAAVPLGLALRAGSP